jgi:hypothetical protein
MGLKEADLLEDYSGSELSDLNEEAREGLWGLDVLAGKVLLRDLSEKRKSDRKTRSSFRQKHSIG